MKKSIALLLMLLLLVPTAKAAETRYKYEASEWARKDVENAKALGFDYRLYGGNLRLPIDRGVFAENAASLVAVEFGSNIKSYLLIMNYRGEAVSGEPVDLQALDVAKNLGIIQGRGDEDWGVYSPITRQEAAVMLARTYRAYQGNVPDRVKPLTFSDQNDIADWALDDVQLMNQLGIMTGFGDGRFDPKGSYTIEQCLVTLLRLHEKAPYDGSKQENPFTIPKLDGVFMKSFEKSNFVFAIETEDYYICARSYRTQSVIGSHYYYIDIINQDLSMQSYLTAIITGSSYRGDYHARPENPAISADGTMLFYTATVEEDVYHVDVYDNRGQAPILLKGIYTVTMDLKTGEQTHTRADLN